MWIFDPNTGAIIEFAEGKPTGRIFLTHGMSGDQPGEPWLNQLRLGYDEMWAMWAAFANRPDGYLVGGSPAVPRYSHRIAPAWVMSNDGMPYKNPLGGR